MLMHNAVLDKGHLARAMQAGGNLSCMLTSSMTLLNWPAFLTPACRQFSALCAALDVLGSSVHALTRNLTRLASFRP